MINETDNPGSHEKNKKKNWFHSLSRRRKSSTSTSTSNSTSQMPQSSDSTGVSEVAPVANISPAECSKKERKRKDERKNVFQRFKKRMGLHFSIREKKTNVEPMSSSSNVQVGDAVVSCLFDRANDLDSVEMIPFTHHYKAFVAKKWLENGSRPNRVMYNACSEMLSQVWYWGEISRHDAQLQLTDKPVGSFLVRDSETGDSLKCWYTLSFRVLNRTLHYRLEYRSNYWEFEELQYESIVEMIEDILHRCTKEHFVCFVRVSNELQPPLPVVLKHPVSRYIKIMKLQDLCRRVIQRTFSEEEIKKFDIPVKLQEYLGEKRELVFQSS